jgi:Arm domain-containing DNA-binding protein
MPRPNKATGVPARKARKMKLTVNGVRDAKREAHAYRVWDSFARGLVLVIQPSGARSYHIIYRHNGGRRDYFIGSAGAVSLKAARLITSEVTDAVAHGRDPWAERRAEQNAGTFAEAVDRYALYTKNKKGNKSWQQSDRLMRRYLMPKWGAWKIDAIKRADVKSLIGKIEAPILANQILKNAGALFGWALREEMIALNPCIGVEKNPSTTRERFLTDSEIPKFWAAFDNAGPVRSAALRTVLLCGQRPGEISSMRWEHIDGILWTLPGKPEPKTKWPGTKNGETHNRRRPAASTNS